MENICLLDNIQAQDFIFYGKNEEVFSSTSWNEEIQVSNKSQRVIRTIINGSTIRKEIGNRIRCKVYDGICKIEDIDFGDLEDDYIEFPKKLSMVNHVCKIDSQNIDELKKKCEFIIKKYDYKELFRFLQEKFAESELELIEMMGSCQYVLFYLTNSFGKKGYGYKNIINTHLTYKASGKIESRSKLFIGTDIYGSFKNLFNELKSDIFIDKVGVKSYIPSDIKEVVFASSIFAKLIYIFYFTNYMNKINCLNDKIDDISKLLTIKLNDPENKSVGGNIDGAGNELKAQYICQKGKYMQIDSPLRRYDYRENLQFKLDKVRILPGAINIAAKKKEHIVVIEKIHGVEESFDPATMNIIGLAQGTEYNDKKIVGKIEITLKMNVMEILQSISGVGNKCNYELDGNILAPDVLLPSKIFNN